MEKIGSKFRTSELTTKHQRFFNEKLGKKEIENVIKMMEGRERKSEKEREKERERKKERERERERGGTPERKKEENEKKMKRNVGKNFKS